MEEKFTYDFTQVCDNALPEFHRQAELWLEGTVKLAIAADGRATTSTGILAAATGAMLVLAANLAISPTPHHPLLISILIASAFLLAGAFYCARAARPIDFYVTGYEPKLLYPVAVSESHIRRISAASIQERIDSNTNSLANAALKLKCGQLIAALAAPAFLISLICSYFFHL